MPAFVAGGCLICLGSVLFFAHRQSWRSRANDAEITPNDLAYFRQQFVRRSQVAWLLAFIGALLPLGDSILPRFFPPQEHPNWYALFWIMVLALAPWIMLLAVRDMAATRLHGEKAMSRLRESQRKMEQEIQALRAKNNGSAK